ncbi:hypothetical protein LCGC14_2525150 [marine sediment metagenome]|uniref:Uncharacterized protein n=1 Tax=marine sediment metagenome TaxID=412755 RepID=A0A0F9D6R5_9ZZZZ
MGQTQRVSGRATSVFTDDDGIVNVVYHATHVVRVFPSGKIVLDTGGWRTVTTRTRMNQAANQFRLGYRVFQKDFGWFVEWKGETLPFDERTIALDN